MSNLVHTRVVRPRLSSYSPALIPPAMAASLATSLATFAASRPLPQPFLEPHPTHSHTPSAHTTSPRRRTSPSSNARLLKHIRARGELPIQPRLRILLASYFLNSTTLLLSLRFLARLRVRVRTHHMRQAQARGQAQSAGAQVGLAQVQPHGVHEFSSALSRRGITPMSVVHGGASELRSGSHLVRPRVPSPTPTRVVRPRVFSPTPIPLSTSLAVSLATFYFPSARALASDPRHASPPHPPLLPPERPQPFRSCSPLALPHVASNASIAASSRNSTSIHLGLAAEHIAAADHPTHSVSHPTAHPRSTPSSSSPPPASMMGEPCLQPDLGPAWKPPSGPRARTRRASSPEPEYTPRRRPPPKPARPRQPHKPREPREPRRPRQPREPHQPRQPRQPRTPSTPPDDIWSVICSDLPTPTPSVARCTDLDKPITFLRPCLTCGPHGWAGNAFSSFPPPWASDSHLSWLRMPLILAAAGHPSGLHILRSLPTFGVIPPSLLSFSDERPCPPHSTILPLGFLVAGYKAAISALGIGLPDLTRRFDGHLHLPAQVQDGLADYASAAIGHADHVCMEAAVASSLLSWLTRRTRQADAVSANPPPAPTLEATPADMLSDASLRSRIFAAAGLPPPSHGCYPRRDLGAARPTDPTTLHRIFRDAHRCTTYGSEPPPSDFDYTCSICMDVDSTPGGPCALSSPAHFCRHKMSHQAMRDWLHLPCGHRVHRACFTQAACCHPSDDPRTSHTALACPVCPPSASSFPPFVAGYHNSTLTLATPCATGSLTLSFELPAAPLPPVAFQRPPDPDLGCMTWCPFSDPRTSRPCHHYFTSAIEARDHIRTHHRSAAALNPAGGPPDLRWCGLMVCTDCVDVCPLSNWDSHCSSCPHRRARLRAALPRPVPTPDPGPLDWSFLLPPNPNPIPNPNPNPNPNPTQDILLHYRRLEAA